MKLPGLVLVIGALAAFNVLVWLIPTTELANSTLAQQLGSDKLGPPTSQGAVKPYYALTYHDQETLR